MLHDICDGILFKQNCLLQNSDKALQIIAYFDELVLTNPIGSRRHKIGKKYIYKYQGFCFVGHKVCFTSNSFYSLNLCLANFFCCCVANVHWHNQLYLCVVESGHC